MVLVLVVVCIGCALVCRECVCVRVAKGELVGDFNRPCASVPLCAWPGRWLPGWSSQFQPRSTTSTNLRGMSSSTVSIHK